VLNVLSRIYVYTLIPLLIMLVVVLLTFHIALLAGSHLKPNDRLFELFLAINLPILGFAKDRNIWANEVKQSPPWLRFTCRILFGYCMVIVLLCIFVGDMDVPANFFLAASAFMLAFTSACACVLWITVQSARSNTIDLNERARRSLICVAILSAAYLRSIFLPSKPISH
jgi:hypothetical protein